MTSYVLPGKVMAAAMASALLALSAACAPAAPPTPTATPTSMPAPAATPTPTPTLAPTPTPTPPPMRAEDLRVVEQRQVVFEGDGVQALLWWSEDGKEFIIARERSQWVQMERARGQWDKCGNDYVQGSYVWRAHADGSREFLVESFDSPSVSPDGRYLLYTADLTCEFENEERFARSLSLLDLRTLETRPLSEWTGRQIISPPWLAGGSAAVLFMGEDGIWSVATDGTLQRQLNDLWASAPKVITMTTAAVSPDGRRLAYLERSVADPGAGATLWSADMDGSNQRQLASGAAHYATAWSPDSSRLAYLSLGESNLHVVTFTSEGVSEAAAFELQTEPPGGRFEGLLWSPNGSFIALSYQSEQTGVMLPSTSIYVLNADGTGLRKLLSLDFLALSPRWSSDGRILFVMVPKSIAGGGDLWALALDDEAAKGLSSEPTSLYVRADPTPVAPNLYVYLEPENVSSELRLEASPVALTQEGVTLVRNRQELERAVGPETRAVLLNREGMGEVDPAWLRGQYEAGRLIYGAWVSGQELKNLLDAQAPVTLYKYSPGGEFLRGYLEKNPEGKPTYGGGRGTLSTPRITLYELVRDLSMHGKSLADLMDAPRRPGAPPPTPTPLPTATPAPEHASRPAGATPEPRPDIVLFTDTADSLPFTHEEAEQAGFLVVHTESDLETRTPPGALAIIITNTTKDAVHQPWLTERLYQGVYVGGIGIPMSELAAIAGANPPGGPDAHPTNLYLSVVHQTVCEDGRRSSGATLMPLGDANKLASDVRMYYSLACP
ncbi:MAG: hypothetical protein Q8P22_03435 [Chloroflexota bacterium]|nr:hypothetical protein [Chloroflexota bacterium]